MKIVGASKSPSLRELFDWFGPEDGIPEHEVVQAEDLPQPYHGLLDHEHHMTVTVETYYSSLVDVRILARRQEGDLYGRKILLALAGTEKVVQFGIMRIGLNYCSLEVREAILAGQTPLGRVLIEHEVLRRIEPTALLRVIPGPAMMGWFGMKEPIPTYGRLALIHYDNQPAVELLEILNVIDK